VVENIGQDTRCEVHQTLLGIREGKEGKDLILFLVKRTRINNFQN
jgi:hypothetical protein